MDDLTNEELYRRVRDGDDDEARAELYRRLGPAVVLAAARILDAAQARELAQHVLVDFLYPPPHREVDHVARYLSVVVRNASLTHLDGAQRRRREEGEFALQKFGGAGVESASQRTQEPGEPPRRRLHAALARLSPFQRECLTLFYFGDHTYKEIVEMTETDFRRVKTAIQNGKKRLRNLLDHDSL